MRKPEEMRPRSLGQKRRIYEMISDDIRQSIFRGHYKAGANLETEEFLAQRFDCSVGTVRKAYDGLVQEGLVNRRQGRGHFVSDAPPIRRHIVGVIASDMLGGTYSPFFHDLARLIKKACGKSGFRLILLGENTPVTETEAQLLASASGLIGMPTVRTSSPRKIAKRYKLPAVYLNSSPADSQTVWLDAEQGTRLCIDRLQEICPTLEQITSFHLGKAEWEAVRQMTRRSGLRLKRVSVPAKGRMQAQEAVSYEAALGVIDSLSPRSGVLLLDDIVARGVTRALLGHFADRSKNLKVCVKTGVQQRLPLGLQAQYICHDTEELATAAVAMLKRDMEGMRPSGPVYVQYHLAEGPPNPTPLHHGPEAVSTL